MKATKKILLFALTLVMFCCCTVLFANAANGISEFAVQTDINETQIQINWWNDGSNYYLFLRALRCS